MASKVDLSKLAPGHYWAQCGDEIVLLLIEHGDRCAHAMSIGGRWCVAATECNDWEWLKEEADVPHPTRVWPVEFPKEPPVLRVRDLAVGSVFRLLRGKDNDEPWAIIHLSGRRSMLHMTTGFQGYEPMDEDQPVELLFDGATITKGGE